MPEKEPNLAIEQALKEATEERKIALPGHNGYIPENDYVLENPLINSAKIKEQLANYQKKRELYEQQQLSQLKNNKIKKYRHFSLFKLMIIFLMIIILFFGLLFINDRFSLVKLPFTLKDIFEGFYNTCKEYIQKVKKLFSYIKERIF